MKVIRSLTSRELDLLDSQDMANTLGGDRPRPPRDEVRVKIGPGDIKPGIGVGVSIVF